MKEEEPTRGELRTSLLTSVLCSLACVGYVAWPETREPWLFVALALWNIAAAVYATLECMKRGYL